MVFYGSLIAAVTLGAFFSRQELLRAQTYAFTVLGLSELFHAVGMRSLTGSAFSRSLGKNPLMLAAFLVGILMQVAVTEIPFLTASAMASLYRISPWSNISFPAM